MSYLSLPFRCRNFPSILHLTFLFLLRFSTLRGLRQGPQPDFLRGGALQTVTHVPFTFLELFVSLVSLACSPVRRSKGPILQSVVNLEYHGGQSLLLVLTCVAVAVRFFSLSMDWFAT